MAAVNPPGTTLETIIQKVRRITRTPSPLQLTDQQIADYVNTFVIYDMPDSIKTFDLKTTFTWYCNPYQDVYNTDTSVLPTTNPLYNFKNLYISIEPPIYVAGNEIYYAQSREEFYGFYPLNSIIAQIGAGDGVTTNFTGTFSAVPVVAGDVTFSSVTTANTGLSARDVPNNPFDGTGILQDTNTGLNIGTIDYVTGVFNITFAVAPASGQAVNAQTLPYQPSMPTALLYYDNQFTLRPVPDQPYPITMDVYKRPTAILDTNDFPALNELWQYLAWGAAKKIFEDRMDLDSVQQMMSMFKEQEILAMRKTIMQLRNQRSSTIYTQQSGLGSSPFFFGAGFGNF